MIQSLSHYKAKYNKLICVDSDGCAIDSMTIKHERALVQRLSKNGTSKMSQKES